MKTNVKIVENSETGIVVKMRAITNSKTGEVSNVGSVMVQQSVVSGFSRIGHASKRTAFLTLSEDALAVMQPYLKHGTELPFKGQIVINETLTPYTYKSGPKAGQNQDHKIFPKGHALAGQAITFNGQKVYRNTLFTEDMSIQDVLLKDNVGAVEATEAVDAEE
tara:strand:- start:249 stop:740 length:492 start_codon:yes stop_codon:yes gene_type:complete